VFYVVIFLIYYAYLSLLGSCDYFEVLLPKLILVFMHEIFRKYEITL
jgi:hypothetical protein